MGSWEACAVFICSDSTIWRLYSVMSGAPKSIYSLPTLKWGNLFVVFIEAHLTSVFLVEYTTGFFSANHWLFLIYAQLECWFSRDGHPSSKSFTSSLGQMDWKVLYRAHSLWTAWTRTDWACVGSVLVGFVLVGFVFLGIWLPFRLSYLCIIGYSTHSCSAWDCTLSVGTSVIISVALGTC